MATQKYMPRGETTPQGQAQNDATHNVYGKQRRAEIGFNGDNPTAGANTTPAPTKPAPTPDELRSTSWGRELYGANGYDGSSSLLPGESTKPFAGAAQPQPDTTLEVIKSKSQKLIEHDASGIDRMLTNSQMRDISHTSQHKEQPSPTAFGMKDPNKADEVVPQVDPSRRVQELSAPVRQPPSGGTLDLSKQK